MPVRVGKSYVSEAALSFAQAQEYDGGNILQDLAEKFPNLKFSVGTAPFFGSGLGNVAISPKILREMQENPDKRVEYEALLYDVANLNWNRDPSVKSSGVIIDANGDMSMWSISKSDDGKNSRAKTALDKNHKSWWQKILDELNKKTDGETNGKVGFNESKRARQLDAAQTKREVRAILELLQEDLEECRDGLAKNMCDEAEVKKVEAMIERAQKRLSEVDETAAAPSIDVLI